MGNKNIRKEKKKPKASKNAAKSNSDSTLVSIVKKADPEIVSIVKKPEPPKE